MASKKPMVLIVDDNPQNVQVLGNIIEKEGYDIAVSMTGKESLNFLENKKPDIILLHDA